MPDVKVYYPAGMLRDTDKLLLMFTIGQSTARSMSCKEVDVTPDQIDIFLIAYDPVDVRLGTTVVIEVAAYAYPSRMSDIDRRLLTIANAVEDNLYELLGDGIETDDESFTSASFTALGEKCWVKTQPLA